MYVKTKKVMLKNGKIQHYYYIAMSVRRGNHVKPVIIRYVGKTIPQEIRWWMKNKNEWLRQNKKERMKIKREEKKRL